MHLLLPFYAIRHFHSLILFEPIQLRFCSRFTFSLYVHILTILPISFYIPIYYLLVNTYITYCMLIHDFPISLTVIWTSSSTVDDQPNWSIVSYELLMGLKKCFSVGEVISGRRRRAGSAAAAAAPVPDGQQRLTLGDCRAARASHGAHKGGRQLPTPRVQAPSPPPDHRYDSTNVLNQCD